MNYIKQLQADLESALNRESALRAGLSQLEAYLMLPKFHQDTTVQVADVFLRINEIRSASY